MSHQNTNGDQALGEVLARSGADIVVADINQAPAAQWLRVIDTNLNGPFLLARCAASTAARRAWPNASAYHASKWGLLGLSHALHAELCPYNIKVTAVIAGGMRTPFPLDRFPDIDIDTLRDPRNVAQAIRSVLLMTEGSVIAEVTVLPLQETSWP